MYNHMLHYSFWLKQVLSCPHPCTGHWHYATAVKMPIFIPKIYFSSSTRTGDQVNASSLSGFYGLYRESQRPVPRDNNANYDHLCDNNANYH